MSVLAHGSPRSVSDFEFATLGAGGMGSILGTHLARARSLHLPLLEVFLRIVAAIDRTRLVPGS